jgi:ribosomal protein S18 acetylase RimI-like enzyme
MRIEIRQFEPSDGPEVIALWRESGLTVPWNDPKKDIGRKHSAQPELFLVGVDGTRVVASMMVGYDGHRGSIFYLAVIPELRRRGIGRQMVEEAEKRLKAVGCPKVNLLVRSSNQSVIEFYRRLGFSVDDVVNLGKRLEKEDADA